MGLLERKQKVIAQMDDKELVADIQELLTYDEDTRLVGEELGLEDGVYSTSFQSRLGFDPWLQPYTDRTIERLGKEGTKSMAIATPAFVSDCLETLEEIAMEGEEIFHEVGGKEFTTIPCLNDDPAWVSLLAKWVTAWASK